MKAAFAKLFFENSAIIVDMENEAIFRLAAFISLFTVLIILETAFPKRIRSESRILRWPGNIGITLLNTLVVRFFMPLLPVTMALWGQKHGWGLFHLFHLPDPLNIIISIVLLDMLIYFQHFVFHRNCLLWKLHMIHHVDHDIDVTSALRFHTFEILFSLALKVLFAFLLGIHSFGMMLFEVLLNGMAMFNHANLRLPVKVDLVMRRFIVTPDMHRIHHSVKYEESNSNFGFNLSLWDRIFQTYIPSPAGGQHDFKIGLPGYSNKKYQYFHYLLALPFMSRSRKKDA